MRDALATLPIPGRLLALLLLLLSALMAPHASNLSPSVLAFFYITAVWRMLAIHRPDWMPGRWTLMLLMVAALALVVFSTEISDGRLAGTALLVVMLGLKLLELRARRDIHVTVFLGYFLVLTQLLYDQSLALAIYLFVGVVALTVIQVGLNRVHVDLLRQARNTLAILGGALPLALVVFLLFPRLDAPLWAINTNSAVTGISGEMTLGDIGKLSQSNAVAFRATFFGAEPRPEQRYWRGPVLWQTDGRRWSGSARTALLQQPTTRRSAPLQYEVIMEPTGEYWMFGLDLVVDIPQGAQLNRNSALVGKQRIDKRLSYRAGSDPYQSPAMLGEYERELGLQLPQQLSARIRELAGRWQAEAAGEPAQIAQKALDFFRQQPFVYTLAPGQLGNDPVDQFLFDTQRGFCEHYASGFVTLMRAAGVPARIVIGYQGGEFNPRAGHWIVRQSDAHAWAEIWLAGSGWSRFDPTAAVAPERIERSINNSVAGEGAAIVYRGDGDGMFSDLLRNVEWIADAVDLGWHRWVIGFSAERQSNLLQMLGLGELRGLGLAIALLIGAALAAGLAYLVMRWRQPKIRDPLPRMWQRFVVKLRRAGITVHNWQGADTVCSLAMQRFPGASDQLVAINRLYVQLRYGRRRDPRQMQSLQQRIRALRLRARDAVAQ
ncbi:MAG: DUF3488 domain-containing transglutaminase family protein [Gammaproteobacteria bacterium]|nr:DUF3488 domain-containing transglutaminase family protein [Gammaproteobacteria bacterium]